ncbi:MAG: hypothetical protein KC414_14220 [Romboutsia sp.]|nr:hypothetical protein [Romboutsia sp.]
MKFTQLPNFVVLDDEIFNGCDLDYDKAFRLFQILTITSDIYIDQFGFIDNLQKYGKIYKCIHAGSVGSSYGVHLCTYDACKSNDIEIINWFCKKQNISFDNQYFINGIIAFDNCSDAVLDWLWFEKGLKESFANNTNYIRSLLHAILYANNLDKLKWLYSLDYIKEYFVGQGVLRHTLIHNSVDICQWLHSTLNAFADTGIDFYNDTYFYHEAMTYGGMPKIIWLVHTFTSRDQSQIRLTASSIHFS